MPRDAVSRTANIERNGRHKWVKAIDISMQMFQQSIHIFLNNLGYVDEIINHIYVFDVGLTICKAFPLTETREKLTASWEIPGFYLY